MSCGKISTNQQETINHLFSGRYLFTVFFYLYADLINNGHFLMQMAAVVDQREKGNEFPTPEDLGRVNSSKGRQL